MIQVAVWRWVGALSVQTSCIAIEKALATAAAKKSKDLSLSLRRQQGRLVGKKGRAAGGRGAIGSAAKTTEGRKEARKD